MDKEKQTKNGELHLSSEDTLLEEIGLTRSVLDQTFMRNSSSEVRKLRSVP